MLRHVTVIVAVAALLGGCTSSSDGGDDGAATPDQPKAGLPVLAFTLDDGDRSRIVASGSHRDVDGSVRAFLPNGSVLLERFSEEGDGDDALLVADATEEKASAEAKVEGLGSGASGFGRGTVLAVSVAESGRQALKVFDLALKEIRSVPLTGNGFVGDPGSPKATTYRNLVEVDGAVLMRRADWKGPDSTADAVVRVDTDGHMTTVLKDEHVTDLTLSADGRAVVANVATDFPYYEGASETADVVELDPKTGRITERFGVPPPCRDYKTVIDDASCVERLGKVGETIVAVIYESDGGDSFSAYSTWQFADGRWSEVKDQRDKVVRWQSKSQRLEQAVDLDGSDETPAPIEWVDGSEREAVKDVSGVFPHDWIAPGSLVKP
jgi:hypothetical protein